MNLLRPNQIAELNDEKDSLRKKLAMADVLPIDKGAVIGQLKRVERHLEVQSPKPVEGKEADAISKKNKTLLQEILVGMPSQEEMRKNPPGAVDKHRKWEARNKQKIMEWKNTELRLNAGTDDIDVANLERYRPVQSTLNMHNAQIAGTQYYIPPGQLSVHNLMTEQDRDEMAAQRRKLIKQAFDNNDYALARFLNVDLDELKKEASDK